MKSLQLLSVLLVEDDYEISKTFTDSLEYFFKKVYVASDGIEALEILQENKIDVIFSDYEMPNMNGYEFIKRVRTFDTKIPITVISNHDDKEKLQKCIPLGLTGYLFKPIKFQDFYEHMKTIEQKFIDIGIVQYQFGTTHILDLVNHQLIEDDKIHSLSKLEFNFLKLFSSLDGQVATFEEINEQLYEFNLANSALKNLVYRIKKKYNFNYIKSIKDIGYTIVK